MWAAYKGRTEVAALLLDRGADPNAAGNFHISALLWASGRGHTDIVRDLVRHGSKVNMGDKASACRCFRVGPMRWGGGGMPIGRVCKLKAVSFHFRSL